MQSLQRSIRSAPGRLDAFGAAFEATGLVVACVAGGHILLATAGVAGFGLNAAQQYMTDSLGKLKKILWKVQVLHLVLQVSGQHELPCCQSGAWCWVQPGRWPGSDSVEGMKNFVKPSNPTNLRAILVRVALMQGGLHLKISTLRFSLSQVKSKKAKQMKPKMMNPWHQLYQMIFLMTWPRYPTPCCPHFCLKKKTVHPKKPDLRLAGCAWAKALWMACKPALFCRQRFLRTENQDIVTLSSKCWYFLAQPALWEDVLDGCILLRSQFQYQMSNWKSKNKRLIQRSRHNLRRCWVHEHHLCRVSII